MTGMGPQLQRLPPDDDLEPMDALAVICGTVCVMLAAGLVWICC